MIECTWTEISKLPPMLRAQVSLSNLHSMVTSRLYKLDRKYRKIYSSTSTRVIVTIFLSDDRQDMIRLVTDSDKMSVLLTCDNEALLPELHKAMEPLMVYVDDYRQQMMVDALRGTEPKQI